MVGRSKSGETLVIVVYYYEMKNDSFVKSIFGHRNKVAVHVVSG